MKVFLAKKILSLTLSWIMTPLVGINLWLRFEKKSEKECELRERLELSLSSPDDASCAAENLNSRSKGMAKQCGDSVATLTLW